MLLLLFYIGISLSLELVFIALAIWCNFSLEHSLVLGAIVFSLSMIALCISAINQEENE